MPHAIVVRTARIQDFSAIAKRIAILSRDPRTHCIQSDVHNGAERIQSEMERLHREGVLRFVVAEESGALVGALGCEYDPKVGRGWLRGPILPLETQDWLGTASSMYRFLMGNLPPLERLDAFVDVHYESAAALYAGLGFREQDTVHVYEAGSAPSEISPHGCRVMTEGDAAAVAALHDAAFKNVWIRGDGIPGALDDDLRVFVHEERGEVDGYLLATYDRDLEEGVVEFLAVRPERRGRGIGYQLLLAAQEWLFGNQKARAASLTVRDELADARALYIKAGFSPKYAGVNFRRVSVPGG